MGKESPSFDELREANLKKLYHVNPEWQALAGREHRMPNQFSPIVPKEEQTPEPIGRSQIFPYATGEPVKETR